MAVQLPEYAWISINDADNDSKLTAQINAVVVSNDKGKQTVQIKLVTSSGMRRMDVYGDNLRTLIGQYGTDEDAWIGKAIIIHFIPTENRKGDKIVKKVIMK